MVKRGGFGTLIALNRGAVVQYGSPEGAIWVAVFYLCATLELNLPPKKDCAPSGALFLSIALNKV